MRQTNKFIVLLLLAVLTANLYWAKVRHLTGDEPHYLTIASSIVKDRDIALKNNYDNRDYLSFYNQKILTGDRHISSNSTVSGEYSLHNVGLPLALLPGFVVAGRIGVALELFVVAAVYILLMYKITARIIANKRRLIYMNAVCSLSAPIVLYAHIISNEIIVATILLYYLFSNYFSRSKTNLVVSNILLSVLPWMHIKYLFLLLTLLLINIFKKDKKTTVINGISVSLSLLLLALFMRHYYGSYLFTAQYPTEFPNLLNTVKGLFGYFFDESFGILIFSPILLLLPVALMVSFGQNKRFARASVFIFVTVWLANSLYANKIGWGPAGRMMVVLSPIIFIWLTYLLDSLKGKFASRWFYFLGSLSVGLGLICSFIPPISYNTGGQNRLFVGLENISKINFSPIFPKLIAITDYLPQTNGWVDVTASSWLKLAVLVLAVAALNIWVYKQEVKSI